MIFLADLDKMKIIRRFLTKINRYSFNVKPETEKLVELIYTTIKFE